MDDEEKGILSVSIPFNRSTNGGMPMKIENWKGHNIRFVLREDGKWWAVAADIAKALGYSHTPSMVRMLRENQKGVHLVHTPGGKQKLTVISERGIYKCIMQSKRKEAEEFEDWVYEVLETLREKSGLEGFQVFRMMDKEHQKKISAEIHGNVPNPSKFDHIKVNTVANKVVSSLFGFDKSMKKHEMTPEMLKARQPILEETKDLHIMKEKYDLNFSVSETLKKRWLNSQTH